MNMSYCRFENTCNDMMDCLASLGEPQGASDREIDKAKQMFEEILNTMREFCIIEDYNHEYLYDAIEIMAEPEEIEY